MRKRPEIPEDLFFDQAAPQTDERAQEETPLTQQNGKPLRHYTRLTKSRVGRPPLLDGPKVAVTVYLTEPVARRLEEARYLLLSEHGVKTSKSALADFALRVGLGDLEAAADDLRRE